MPEGIPSIKTTKVILGCAFLLLAGLAAGFMIERRQTYPEPEALIGSIRTAGTFREQKKIYEELIELAGPEEAQDSLLGSGLPFTGATHLLNHTVGEYLYRNRGLAGITACKEYFLASCYHGFIITAVAKEGPGVIERVISTCAAKNEATLGQCSHALGHGLLALMGYQALPGALEACDTISTLPERRRFNCYDGVFMENIWGVHEGTPSPERWIRAGDDTYPCSAREIAEKYRGACWGNQPALLYRELKQDIPQTAAVCEKAPEAYREACFDGLARQIHPLAGKNTESAAAYCALIPSAWQDRCLLSIANAADAVGDTVLPYQLCQRMQTELKSACAKFKP